MQVWIVVFLFILGVALIVKGGDWFLNGAVWMAEISGVPRFIIGATVVSIATTLPELTVSVIGVMKQQVDLAVGNAVGSVTANLGLIMGISVLFMPSVIDKKHFNFKAILMLGGAVVLTTLCLSGTLPFLPSLLLFAIFGLYLVNNIQDARAGIKDRTVPKGDQWTVSRRKTAGKIASFAAGIAGILIGSQLLIDYGSELALILGVPPAIIGVTLVAVGTSLPELVTTISALVKKEAAMSIGNIVGANVIDLTLILPICSAISGGQLSIAPQTVLLDLPACLTEAAIAVVPPLIKGKFYRWQGVALLGVYLLYMIKLVA